MADCYGYPETIDEQELVRQAHIPDDEIRDDITVTEAEIMMHRRLNHDPEGVAKRQAFVGYLRRLLEARHG